MRICTVAIWMSSTSSDLTVEMKFQFRKQEKSTELDLVSIKDVLFVQSWVSFP